MFSETYYEPTEVDYQDWIEVLKLQEEEDFGPSDEMLINWNEANDYMHEGEDENNEDEEPIDDMDGNHESAMTSIGWGTDEDYGYYGDE